MNDLSSSAILTTTDLHFRAQQVVPKSGSRGVSEEAGGAFIRKLEPRTATQIVNSSASPHTLGVEPSTWSGWKVELCCGKFHMGAALFFLNLLIGPSSCRIVFFL